MFDRVKELTKRQGITIEGMLTSAGEIPLNTYNGWRKRKILPRADECYAIAKALGTSVEYLLTGEVEQGIYPQRIEIIINRCMVASEEDLSLVERVLRIESEPGEKSNTRGGIA